MRRPPGLRILELAIRAVVHLTVGGFFVQAAQRVWLSPAWYRPMGLVLVAVTFAAGMWLCWAELDERSPGPWTVGAAMAVVVIGATVLGLGMEPRSAGPPGFTNSQEGRLLQAGVLTGLTLGVPLGLSAHWRRRLFLLPLPTVAMVLLVAAQHVPKPKLMQIAMVMPVLFLVMAGLGILWGRLLDLLRRVGRSQQTYATVAVERQRAQFAERLVSLTDRELHAVEGVAREACTTLAAHPPQWEHATSELRLLHALSQATAERLRTLAHWYHATTPAADDPDTLDVGDAELRDTEVGDAGNSGRDDAAGGEPGPRCVGGWAGLIRQPAETPRVAGPTGNLTPSQARVAAARAWEAPELPVLETLVRWYYYLAVTASLLSLTDRGSLLAPWALEVSLGRVLVVLAGIVLIGRDLRLARDLAWLRAGFIGLAVGTTVLTSARYGPGLADRLGNGLAPLEPADLLRIMVTVVALRWRWHRALAVGVAGLAALGATALALNVPTGITLTALSAGLIGVVFATVEGRAAWWVLDGAWALHGERAALRDLAVLRERTRLARDLHDTQGRLLATMTVKSELAARYAERHDPRAAAEAADVMALTGEARAANEALSLGAAGFDLLDELDAAEQLLVAAGIPLALAGVELTHALPPSGREALAAVVREGVTNIVRHAHPDPDAPTGEAELRFIRENDAPGDVVLRVTNATGPVAPGSPVDGMGLAGLAERVREAGGELIVDRPPGRFVLTARVPAGRAATAEPGRAPVAAPTG